MNDSEQILAELKKIAAWTDMQRKMTKWSLIFVAVFVPAIILLAIVIDTRFKKKLEHIKTTQELTWYDVDRNLRNGKQDEAIRIGQELIQRAPLSPDGHIRLANAYLTIGDVTNANTHYTEAVRLFPSEDYQKLLNALTKRMEQENARQLRGN